MATGRPGPGSGEDCGKKMHVWHVTLYDASERGYCHKCGKLRHRRKKKA